MKRLRAQFVLSLQNGGRNSALLKGLYIDISAKKQKDYLNDRLCHVWSQLMSFHSLVIADRAHFNRIVKCWLVLRLHISDLNQRKVRIPLKKWQIKRIRPALYLLQVDLVALFEIVLHGNFLAVKNELSCGSAVRTQLTNFKAFRPPSVRGLNKKA